MGENATVMRYRAAALAVFALLGLAASSPAKDEFPVKVTVCVRGAEKGGFVTAEIGDSVKDLKENLGDKDVLQLTDDAKSADLVVVIQGRGNVETGRRVYSSHSSGRHYSSSSSKETVRVVRGVLVAGSYKVEMVGVNTPRSGARPRTTSARRSSTGPRTTTRSSWLAATRTKRPSRVLAWIPRPRVARLGRRQVPGPRRVGTRTRRSSRA